MKIPTLFASFFFLCGTAISFQFHGHVALRSSGGALYAAGIPKIDQWKVLRNGSLRGLVVNHPTIEDGDVITTSSLATGFDLVAGGIVATKSGSKYKLAAPAPGQKEIAQDGNSKISQKGKVTVARSKKVVKSSPFAKSNPLRIKLNLNGKSIGNGKYLLVGKPKTSSLKSQIFSGFRTDKDGQPTGDELTIKLSTNYEALERENRNYKKAAGGIFPGAFVNKIEFMAYADGKGFDDFSALVLEAGKKDLRALLTERGGKGLDGRSMRDAAAAIGQCVQAMHSSNLVWTDIKAENFVVVSDSNGESGLPGVRGIDLESAMPIRGNPVDYSPEACPPEFAAVFMKGDGASFTLDPSYDIWSAGMLLYELSTGKPYFKGKNPAVITKQLKLPNFEMNVSAIADTKLRDLMEKCLQKDPKKRPSITEFLLHPYFITSGIGSWSF